MRNGLPPADAAFPAQAVLTSREPRIYFNLPSEIGRFFMKVWPKLMTKESSS